MNTTFSQNVARAAGILLIVILAAAAGLAAGNALQQVREASITAQAGFSQVALDDVAATRDERPAAAAYPDYAIRHSPATSEADDWALRHRVLAAPTTSTFRLTGPSDTNTELRGQRKAN